MVERGKTVPTPALPASQPNRVPERDPGGWPETVAGVAYVADLLATLYTVTWPAVGEPRTSVPVHAGSPAPAAEPASFKVAAGGSASSG